MRPSRSRSENPVSFFSFQDVMMCTIGVTIVITMTLILQVGAAAAQAELTARADAVDLTRGRGELSQEAAILRQRLQRAAETAPAALAERRGALRQDLRRELERASRAQEQRRRTEASVREAVAQASADPAAIEATELLRRRDELEERLATTQLRRRVTYLLAEDNRKPVVIEVSGSQLVAGTDSERDSPLAIPLSDGEAAFALLKQWIQGLSEPENRTVLFVVKPSGVAMWRAIAARFAQDEALGRLPRGLDLIEEEAYTSDRFRPAAGGAAP
jgi:hypothetical protein